MSTARAVFYLLLLYALCLFCLVFYPLTALQWNANAKHKDHDFVAKSFRDYFWAGIALFLVALAMFSAYLFLPYKSQSLLCTGVLVFVYTLTGIDFFRGIKAYIKLFPVA